MEPQATPPTTPQTSQAPQPLLQTPAQVTQPQVATEPRNLLVAMLIISIVGVAGLHQLYLGRKKQGWTRFGLFFLSIIPFLGVLFGLVLTIWALLDFIHVYKGQPDGDGQPLVATKRDAFVAKILYIIFLVFIGIIVVGMIFAFIITVVSGIQQRS